MHTSMNPETMGQSFPPLDQNLGGWSRKPDLLFSCLKVHHLVQRWWGGLDVRGWRDGREHRIRGRSPAGTGGTNVHHHELGSVFFFVYQDRWKPPNWLTLLLYPFSIVDCFRIDRLRRLGRSMACAHGSSGHPPWLIALKGHPDWFGDAISF